MYIQTERGYGYRFVRPRSTPPEKPALGASTWSGTSSTPAAGGKLGSLPFGDSFGVDAGNLHITFDSKGR